MSNNIATCNLCNEFKVPWDEFGIEFMKAHMKDKHPEYVWKRNDLSMEKETR